MKDNEHISLGERLLSYSARFRGIENHIAITNGNEIIIEGCRGVIEYSDIRIRLSIGKQSLTITGCNLKINNMFTRMVSIEGRVSSIEFS